jgi:roadblock/LC7 domain-containing protein
VTEDLQSIVEKTAAEVVLDTNNGRVVEVAGAIDDDSLEILNHLCDTWRNLLDALLPVLEDTLDRTWTPPRWWSCRGGDQTIVSRDGRSVVVPADVATLFLIAAAGDGIVEGLQIW